MDIKHEIEETRKFNENVRRDNRAFGRVAGYVVAAAAGIGLLAAGLTGCSQKNTEPWNDAPVVGKFDNGAQVYSMPDGFNNFASKCDDNGHRVFVTYHGDGAYGGVFAIDDPACPKH